MNLREQRSLAQIALALQFAVGPLIVYFGSATSRWEAALDVGLLLGQVNLGAILFAWSGRSLSVRISATLFWLAYVWCWLLAHLRNNRVLGGGPEYVLWTLLITLQCATLVLCLWRGRARGLRLQRGGGAAVGSAAERQFGIRQLFIWTAAVALLLGVSRCLDIAEQNQWPDVGLAVHLSVLRLIALIALGHALAGLGACWAVYTRLRLHMRAPGALAFVVLAALLQTALYQQMHPHPDFHWAWWLVHNLANFGLVATTLAILRWCGYELVAQTSPSRGADVKQPTIEA
ncbi:MAG: hypothetical protein U0836_27625 [Pirellulales bacterium]